MSASAPRQYLGSKVDGERAVADLRRGKRAAYRAGLPHRWFRLPAPSHDSAARP